MRTMSRRGVLMSLGLLVVPSPIVNRASHPESLVEMSELAARMTVARAAHTAVPLQDGTLLLMGGFATEDTVLATTDRYDPEFDQLDAGPTMIAARHSHTATVLADGRVLIAGGFHDDALDRAEIYDPATDSFRAIAPMTVARSGHVASNLQDGRVLLAGGVSTDWQFLASAEIFDPATETFTPVGAMATPRESHTGTVLADGRVLIAGGHHGRRSTFTVVQTAEVFDPETEEFAPTGTMVVPRHKHDAILLNEGQVMIVAGADERDSAGAYASTEVYDPVNRTFVSGPTLNTARYKLSGTSIGLVDGTVVVAGGAARAEVLNADGGVFSTVEGAFDGPRLFSTATRVSERRIVVAGGYGSGITASDRLWRIEAGER